jgi:Prohead core protein serine protease
MKLITETLDELQYVTEAKEDGTKNLYIEGIFLQSSIKNRNGRMYPEHVMDKEVERYMKEAVETKTAMGELGHPNGPQINLDRVSHRIVSLRKEGTDYVGKAMITNTPMGNIARGLMESGARLGVSSRGMGTLKLTKEGINEVQDDFRLATAADIVADPSAPNAWVDGIMESVDWVYDERLGWKALDLAEQAKQQINQAIRSRELEEKKLQIFENWLANLSKSS